jgi:putative ABC transport system ATP-binding protein
MSRTEKKAPLLRIRELSHRFGEQQVLFDINLEIGPGELVILTGPSGCGKTTLLTLIGALRSVQEGSLEVLGRQMHGLDRQGLMTARRDIGFIFQAHNLLDALTALENVTLALDLKDFNTEQLSAHTAGLLGVIQDGPSGPDLPRSRDAIAFALAKGLLTHLNLGPHVDKKPGQLSGGQKQRVAIARALCNHPRLILADEPTAALDKVSSGIVIDLLKKLTQHGSTVLVVTHDNRTMDRGDRVVTMKDGRVESNILVDETVRICVFLQKVALFAGLTPSCLLEVAENMRRETFPRGAAILREGDPGDKFYLIKEGKVEVIEKTRPAGTAAVLGSGQFFGDTALLEDRPRDATVVAREPVEVYTLEKDDFLEAQRSFASMREELVKAFAQRSRHA